MPRAPFPAGHEEQRRLVLEYLERRRGRPVTSATLMRQLGVPRERRRAVRRLLEGLEREGAVERRDAGGWVRRHPREVAPERPEKPWVAVLRLDRSRAFARALSLDRERPGAVVLRSGQCRGARDGDVVVLEPPRESRGEAVAGRVREVLGPLEAPGVDGEVVVRLYGLRREFPHPVLLEASKLAAATPRLLAGRELFDDPPPVTLDGETARDFDDAIAVAARPGGGFRLYVHIADVSAYVRPGGPLDREAFARATSVYFPGTVLPMLPPALSEDLCSLRPGELRPVQTVILDVDARGLARRIRVADGVIRSAARLTYRQVAAALEGRRRYAGIPPAILEMLRTADGLRERLEARRRARGSIDFDLPEPEILLDLDGVVTGVIVEPRNRAHRMIEEFMLAANEAVARCLARRRAPCLYRVHEPPDPAKVEALREMARAFGLSWRCEAPHPQPRDFQRLLERARGRPFYPVLAQAVLRSMKQARYAAENLGHFGLAAPVYCHFTSPIRRYADLVVHRLLRACLRGDRRALRQAGGGLEACAAHCSASERNAEAAEREIIAWKLVHFLRGREGERQNGTVVAVAPFGVFVRLADPPVEGLVRIESLGRERWRFDERRQQLRGEATGRVVRVGDTMPVRIVRVDPVQRRVDLAAVEPQPA